MRIYGLISVTVIKSGQQRSICALSFAYKIARHVRSTLFQTIFLKKKRCQPSKTIILSKFHKPFTIYNESIKYHHALNKFPTRSNQRISSRETLPFRINNNGIYSFFFFYQTPQLRTYTRTFTRSCTTKERDDWFDPHRGLGRVHRLTFRTDRGGEERQRTRNPY